MRILRQYRAQFLCFGILAGIGLSNTLPGTLFRLSIADDPEYWGAQSWRLVFDRARCGQIVE